MKMTDEGLALIKRFEGFRGSAYRCPAGLWTIGYGHTSRAGPPAVTPNLRMTEAQAHGVLTADVERFARDVRLALRRDLNDQQFSALVSFAYNVGAGAFLASSVLKAVNAGDFDAVPRRLQLWIKGDGRVLPGLVKRRAAEAEMFMSGNVIQFPLPVPTSIEGKPVRHSSTALSAIAAAAVSVIGGLFSAVAGAGPAAALAAIVVVVAAFWIVRERMRKAREDGI